MSKSIRSRNVWVYVITSSDYVSIIVPVIVLVWTKTGLSFSQILLLQGIFALTVLLAEIPTGVVSDSRSRKASVTIGLGLEGLGSKLSISDLP